MSDVILVPLLNWMAGNTTTIQLSLRKQHCDMDLRRLTRSLDELIASLCVADSS